MHVEYRCPLNIIIKEDYYSIPRNRPFRCGLTTNNTNNFFYLFKHYMEKTTGRFCGFAKQNDETRNNNLELYPNKTNARTTKTGIKL